MADPRRILLLGDTHGQAHAVRSALTAAVAQDCQAVVQLGDFGWWTHTDAGRQFADTADADATEAGVTLYFLGGNHENWDELDRLTESGPRDDGGAVVVGASTRYLPRPHRWQWRGAVLAALGGAWSIDERRRVAHWSWWPQEQPGIEHAEELCDGGPIDVLLCHDAPGELDLSLAAFGGDDRDDGAGGPMSARGPRSLLDMVVARCEPRLVAHGHWHHLHLTELASRPTCVVGLAHDGVRPSDRHAVLVLDDGVRLEAPSAPPVPLRRPWWPGP